MKTRTRHDLPANFRTTNLEISEFLMDRILFVFIYYYCSCSSFVVQLQQQQRPSEIEGGIAVVCVGRDTKILYCAVLCCAVMGVL